MADRARIEACIPLATWSVRNLDSDFTRSSYERWTWVRTPYRRRLTQASLLQLGHHLSNYSPELVLVVDEGHQRAAAGTVRCLASRGALQRQGSVASGDYWESVQL